MKRKRSEHTEQTFFVSRVHELYPAALLFAVPNGGRRGKAEAARLKDEGVLAGVSDLVLLEARGGYLGALIEMKRADGGHGLTPAQSKFLGRARRRGYLAIQCDGADEAWERFEHYMRLPATEIKIPFN